MNIPIVKITLEGMRHELMVALGNYMSNRDSDIAKSIDAAIKNFNIERVIDDALPQLVEETIKSIIQESVFRLRMDTRFRDEIKKAVLSRMETDE